MSAETASAALAQLLADPPSWLPPVDHWEVATDTGHGHGVWTVSGQLAYDGTGDTRPYELMRPIAVESDEPLDDNGRAIRARFQHDGVLFTVWWLRPITRWLVSDCATCQTPLGDPRVSFEQIGTGDDRRVICVPCRDRMHAAWLAGGPDRAAALLAAADTINALAQDYELDPGRGECAALLRRMAAAGLEKDTPAGGESTPATDRRARYIAGSPTPRWPPPTPSCTRSTGTGTPPAASTPGPPGGAWTGSRPWLAGSDAGPAA
ncbi:hypothetical protein ACZ91_64675 [Streptomyces regensis]|nr:hypothetical protein ACZ91_64675 [Streptomyces regensis]